MDNDVPGTDYCIGFSTAVTRSVNFVIDLRTPAGSHERIAVIELFGRYCGETALFTGYLASADRVVISEVPCDIERLAQHLCEDQDRNPSHYAILVVSEGAILTGGVADPERTTRRLRAPQARRDRRHRWRRDRAAHRTPVPRAAARLPDAQRPARLDRPPRRNELREPRVRPADGRPPRRDGRAAEGLLHGRSCRRRRSRESGKVDVENYYDAEQLPAPRISSVLGLPMFLT